MLPYLPLSLQSDATVNLILCTSGPKCRGYLIESNGLIHMVESFDVLHSYQHILSCLCCSISSVALYRQPWSLPQCALASALLILVNDNDSWMSPTNLQSYMHWPSLMCLWTLTMVRLLCHRSYPRFLPCIKSLHQIFSLTFASAFTQPVCQYSTITDPQPS